MWRRCGRGAPSALLRFAESREGDTRDPLIYLHAVNFTVKRLVRASRRRHVMSCGALAPRYEASNLSCDNHLPTNA